MFDKEKHCKEQNKALCTNKQNQIGDDFDDDKEDVKTKDDGVPIDRGWAWVTVLGCFGVLSLVIGSLKSFGVLLVDLSARLGVPVSVILSTQSVAGFLHLALAPFANAMSIRTSHRTVVFTGGLLISIGLITTAFVTSVEWLFVTYGIIAGIGFGLTLSPSLVYMGSHFHHRRSLANGLSASGSGVGAFALPNLLIFLKEEYGFTGCLFIIGAIVFNICMFASLFRPYSFWKRGKSRASTDCNDNIREMEISKENQKLLLSKISGNNHSRLSIYTSYPLSEQKPDVEIPEISSSHPNLHSHRKTDDFYSSVRHISKTVDDFESRMLKRKRYISSFLYSSMGSLPVVPTTDERYLQITPGEKQDLETKRSACLNLLNWTLLKNPVFMIYNLAIWTGIFGHHTVFICLPSLAHEFGLSESDGACLVSLIGLSDFIGRITSGWFSDLQIFKRKRVFQISLGLFTICLLVIPHVTSFPGLCVLSVLTGLSTGGYMGIHLAILADVFGVENLPSTLGFVSFFASLSLLGCPLVSGLTRDMTHTWTNAFILGACVTMVGSLVVFLESVAMNMTSKTYRDEQEIVIS